MQVFEIFDGPSYLLTVMPSENPRQVLEDERRARRNYRLRMMMLENGIRTEVQGPSVFVPRVVEEEESFEGYEDEA